jgi:hypothetical protein
MVEVTLTLRNEEGNASRQCRGNFPLKEHWVVTRLTQECMQQTVHADGSLTIECTIRWFDHDEAKLVAELTSPVPHHSNASFLNTGALNASMGKLLESGMLSDCVIRVGNASIPVHKCILAQRSHVFRTMLAEEGAWEEGGVGVIQIGDFEPATVSPV